MKEAREARKSKKAEIEETWKSWMAEYQTELTAWETNCRDLRECGTRVKDLPKRPKKPLRKDLPALDAEGEVDGDEQDEEEETW